MGYDDADPVLKWDTFQITGGPVGVEILIKCAPDD